jgi:hypothetical protein
VTRDGVNQWFQKAMTNGLIATIAWFIVLILYCAFQALHVDAPGLNQAFLLLTGGWVGMLTLAQSKKNAETQGDVDKLKTVAKKEHPELAGEIDGQ